MLDPLRPSRRFLGLDSREYRLYDQAVRLRAALRATRGIPLLRRERLERKATARVTRRFRAMYGYQPAPTPYRD